MGMFDYVKWRGRQDWQTKDFDCGMELLTVTDDGRLLHDECHYEEVPKSQRPYPDAEEGSIESFCGSLKTVVDRANVEIRFHGYMNVYTSDADPNSDDYERLWTEYKLKFTDGRLVAVEPISEEAKRLEAKRTADDSDGSPR